MNSTLPEDAGKISFLPQPITLTREAWRRYFAGQAMAAIIRKRRFETVDMDHDDGMEKALAVSARIYADALLAELERTKH